MWTKLNPCSIFPSLQIVLTSHSFAKQQMNEAYRLYCHSSHEQQMSISLMPKTCSKCCYTQRWVVNSCNYSPEGHHKNQNFYYNSLPFSPRENLKMKEVLSAAIVLWVSYHKRQPWSRFQKQLPAKSPRFSSSNCTKSKLRVLSHTIEMNITA